jgi:hypothetical protein
LDFILFLGLLLDFFILKRIFIRLLIGNESQDSNEKMWCEVLMIAFAHDVNFIFGFHVGTNFINGTFRDNWNLDLKCACYWILL